MKSRSVVLLIAFIILLDQGIKMYIKTHFRIGENYPVFGTWFNLHFVENEGMAWGWKLNSQVWGKVVLTSFRLIAVIAGVWYLRKIIRQNYNKLFIFCASLIYAGALGNLLDSLFYGVIFDKGMRFSSTINDFIYYDGVAHFSNQGYSKFFLGNVVDMLYFPVIRSTFPSWFPIYANEPFEFFSMVFNVADASISIGVIILLLFQKRMFKAGQPLPGAVRYSEQPS